MRKEPLELEMALVSPRAPSSMSFMRWACILLYKKEKEEEVAFGFETS